jgi:hypothetical protein
VEAHAHEEALGLGITKLRALEDVAGVFQQERADPRHDAHAVGTRQSQDSVIRVGLPGHPSIFESLAPMRQRDKMDSLYLIIE